MDGDIAGLIFSCLEVIDLCMARATCRSWRVLIPPIKPSLARDYLKVVPCYDSDTYIHAIEKWTSFEEDSFKIIMQSRIEGTLIGARAVHTYMHWTRFSGLPLNMFAIWAICYEKSEYWNTILLPCLCAANKDDLHMVFWDSVDSGRIDLVGWMIERRVVNLKDSTMFELGFSFPEQGSPVRLFLFKNPRVPPIFLERWLEHEEKTEIKAKRAKTQTQ